MHESQICRGFAMDLPWIYHEHANQFGVPFFPWDYGINLRATPADTTQEVNLKKQSKPEPILNKVLNDLQTKFSLIYYLSKPSTDFKLQTSLR